MDQALRVGGERSYDGYATGREVVEDQLWLYRRDVTDEAEVDLDAVDPALFGKRSLDEVAHKTDGYTGADLAAIANEAVMSAIREAVASGKGEDPESMKETKVRMRHVMDAVEKHRPISLQELSRFQKIAKDFEYVR